MATKEQSLKRKDIPAHKTIREYWSENLDFSRKTHCCADEILNGDDGEHFCFACGLTEQAGNKLERAHIKALCNGGSNNADNIHILCKTCHVDSEYMDGDVYFEWFYKRTMVHSIVSLAMRKAPGLFSNYLIDNVGLFA